MQVDSGRDSLQYLDGHCCQEKSYLPSRSTAIMEFLCLTAGSTFPTSDLEWKAGSDGQAFRSPIVQSQQARGEPAGGPWFWSEASS